MVLVVQTVRGIEGQTRAGIALVMVMMVVVMVIGALAQVVVMVAGHRGWSHGAELVRVVMGMHGC